MCVSFPPRPFDQLNEIKRIYNKKRLPGIQPLCKLEPPTSLYCFVSNFNLLRDSLTSFNCWKSFMYFTKHSKYNVTALRWRGSRILWRYCRKGWPWENVTNTWRHLWTTPGHKFSCSSFKSFCKLNENQCKFFKKHLNFVT